MKLEQWLAAFAVVVACGKSAESKQDKKPDDNKSDKAEARLTGPFAGFYRVKSAKMNDKIIEIAEAFEASIKSDDPNTKVDLIRMTFEIEAGKLTIGVDQIFGEPGSVTFCSVRAGSDATFDSGKLTLPTIEAVAFAGVVSVKGTSETKDTAKCNVSLKAGTYDVKVRGMEVELSTTSGDPVTLYLVPDKKEIDLKARAVAFAKQK